MRGREILLEIEKLEIGNTIYNPITDMNEFQKFFEKSVLYKVFVEQKLAGYCAYEIRDNEAEIMGLLVIKKFRNRGLGNIMLQKLLYDLKSIPTIKISTSPENILAISFYQKHGFTIKEQKNNYWHGQPRIILYIQK